MQTVVKTMSRSMELGMFRSYREPVVEAKLKSYAMMERAEVRSSHCRLMILSNSMD